MNEKKKLMTILIRKAQEDWRTRHLCLPSLVAAMTLYDMKKSAARAHSSDLLYGPAALFPSRKDGCGGGYVSVEEAVQSHNTYLAEWKTGEQVRPNWEGLAEQKYYILAVQYLQDAQYPYYPEKKAEAELVELIEQNFLHRYDGRSGHVF